MLGRGVRIAKDKNHCKVIDLTSTVGTMGRVETIKVVKKQKWELISETGSWHNKELFAYYPNLNYYKRYDRNAWRFKDKTK